MNFRKVLAYELIFNGVDNTDYDRVTKEGVKTRSKNQH